MGVLRSLITLLAWATGLAALALTIVFAIVPDGEQRRALVLLMGSIALQKVAGALAMSVGWTGLGWTLVNYTGIVIQALGVGAMALYVLHGRDTYHRQ